jgi:Ser/Thr protein kinase RdoA (MazF antagonist)
MLYGPVLRKALSVFRPNSSDLIPFSKEQVAEVLALYPRKEMGDLISCAPLEGTYSHNALLRTTMGQKVLKKYKYHNLMSILPEHSILTFLANHNFQSPRLVANVEGKTYSKVNGQLWALYDFIPGLRYSDFLYFSRRQERLFLRKVTQVLAHYHRLMDGFSPAGRKLDGFKNDGQELWRNCEWHLNVLTQCEAQLRQKDRLDETDQFILNNLSWLKEDYACLGTAFEANHQQLSKVVVHGDYAPHNILFDKKGEVVAVLDFGSARPDVRVRDVTRALETFSRLRLSRLRGVGIDYERAKFLLSIYQADYPLSSAEIEAMPNIWRLGKMRVMIWAIQEYPARPLNLAMLRHMLRFLDWLEANENQLMAALREVC